MILINKFQKSKFVVVYSAGKTGNEALQLSLNKHTNYMTLQTHQLYYDNIIKGDHHPKYGPILYNKFLLNSKQNFKVITLIRNPIDMWFSLFFHRYFKNKEFNDDINIKDVEKDFFNQLDNYFLRGDFFLNDFNKFFNCNIYDYPFDINKGYINLKIDKFDILLLKLELKNDLKEDIIKDFLALENFSWNKNIGHSASNKTYNNFYEQFKKTVKFDKKYLDSFLNSEYIKQFYSKDEIEVFVKKWAK